MTNHEMQEPFVACDRGRRRLPGMAAAVALLASVGAFTACGGSRAESLEPLPRPWADSTDALAVDDAGRDGDGRGVGRGERTREERGRRRGEWTWEPDEPGASGATIAQVDSGTLAGFAADSLSYEVPKPAPVLSARSREIRDAAMEAEGRRVVVALDARELLLLDGADTLLVAPVAIGKGTVLRHEGRVWDFTTPLGIRRVLGRQRNPVWIPPDWHYVEVARERDLEVARLRRGRPVRLDDGALLEVRGDSVGLRRGLAFRALPRGEEIIFDGKVFIPPFGTVHRQIEGELGRFKIDLGEGYLIHGTPHQGTIGDAVTHGCMRLHDEDIAFLYERVTGGTRVYIY